MKVISILILLGLCSCTDNTEHKLVGTWKVTNYTIWEKGVAFLSGVRGFIYGDELTLNSDSTYSGHSCGNIFKGRWSHTGDSLILYCDTMWYRNAKRYIEKVNSHYDSIAGTCSSARTTFFIDENKLVNVYKGKRYRTKEDGTEELASGYSITILK